MLRISDSELWGTVGRKTLFTGTGQRGTSIFVDTLGVNHEGPVEESRRLVLQVRYVSQSCELPTTYNTDVGDVRNARLNFV